MNNKNKQKLILNKTTVSQLEQSATIHQQQAVAQNDRAEAYITEITGYSFLCTIPVKCGSVV